MIGGSLMQCNSWWTCLNLRRRSHFVGLGSGKSTDILDIESTSICDAGPTSVRGQRLQNNGTEASLVAEVCTRETTEQGRRSWRMGCLRVARPTQLSAQRLGGFTH